MSRKHPDYYFISLLSVLVVFGMVMIFSASSAMALKNTGDSLYFAKKHLFYTLLGVIAFYFGFNLNLQKLKKNSIYLVAAGVVLSFLVFIPGIGKKMGGAARWIDFLGISFQPSEFLKIAIIIFLAGVINANRGQIGNFFKGLFPIMLLTMLLVVPILLQPDLGTVLAIVGSAFIMFFIAGSNLLHFSFIFALLGAGVAALSITSPYRLKRLTAFRDPWADPLGSGYQIIQSLIAVSSGGIFGVGLGNSKQKYLYLPQQYADFIFAIMCEEIGLIGAAVFIAILIMFLIRGIVIAGKSEDYFASILAYGIIALFSVQSFLNIAVVLGLVPTTGLPLPFISYGGTSIVINLFAAGLVANISKT